jgi:hypothetical protein
MGLQGRIVKRFPVWLRTAPLDATFCMLGIPAGLLAVLGLTRSSAVATLLPDWGYLLWGVCLFLGCLFWFLGLISIKENNGHLVVTRMPIMIFGLYLSSLSALVFGLAIILIAGSTGLLAAWPVLVFSAGTWLRKVDLAYRFRQEGASDD